MGIFKKKYDYEYDSLRCEFDLEEDRYCFYKNGKRLESNEINLKSRRFLKRKNKLTEEQKQDRRNVAKMVKKQEQERIKMIEAIGRRREAGMDLEYGSFEVSSVVEPKFSDEVRTYLEELTSEEKDGEYVLGIHRIGSSEGHLEDVFNQGIKVQGHMMGAAKGTPELGNTVGYYPSNKTVMKEVAYAYAYKESKGSIVVKIPREDIISNNIYITDEERKNMYLNPKYIVGYFPVEDDRTVAQIVTRDTLADYRQQRAQEAQAYIDMGTKSVEYPPQKKD